MGCICLCRIDVKLSLLISLDSILCTKCLSMCPCSKNDMGLTKVTFGTTTNLCRIIGCYRMSELFGSLRSLNS